MAGRPVTDDGLAPRTETADRQMTDLDREAPRFAEPGHEGLGLGQRDLPGPTAPDAMEMSVLALRQDVEFLAAVDAMTVPHHAQLLQHVERPIDGRWRGLRVGRATTFEEFGRRHVTVRPR
jgi:hypothetical protein